jgi:hypothetical protein
MRRTGAILALLSLTLACRLFSPVEPENATPAQPDTGGTSQPAAAPSLTIEGLYAEYSGEVDTGGGISSYLNAGGAVDQLESQLANTQTGSTEMIKTQVLAQDVTGDGCEDVIVSLALPSVPGYGDAILAAYTCQGDRYVRHNLFGRVGAGSRGEGLYDGGGAHIEGVKDLNADGLPEIPFYVASLSELYIAEWNGTEFVSLIECVDELGNPQGYIPAREGAFEIKDLDEDGVLEIVLSDPPGVWRWDGSLFQPVDE